MTSPLPNNPSISINNSNDSRSLSSPSAAAATAAAHNSVVRIQITDEDGDESTTGGAGDALITVAGSADNLPLLPLATGSGQQQMEANGRDSNMIRLWRDRMSSALQDLPRPRVTISISDATHSLLRDGVHRNSNNNSISASSAPAGDSEGESTPASGHTFHRNLLLAHYQHRQPENGHDDRHSIQLQTHTAAAATASSSSLAPAIASTSTASSSALEISPPQPQPPPPPAPSLDNDSQQQQPAQASPHRTENDVSLSDAMAQIPELRGFVQGFLRYFPFICIILTKACFDHIPSILRICIFFFTFTQANYHLKLEIAKKNQRNCRRLWFELFTISVIMTGLSMFPESDFMIDIVLFQSFRMANSMQELLYFLLLADLMVKSLTVAIKIMVTLMPVRCVNFKGRGRIYLLIEAISQVYRCLMPVKPWIAFFLGSYEGIEKLFGTCLIIAYNCCKIRDLLPVLKFLRNAVKKFIQNSNFGVVPTKKQLESNDGQCPICQEPYNGPILLECSHIFCEVCIGYWFDKEKTCPLCRAVIADDPSFRDGSTSFLVQLF